MKKLNFKYLTLLAAVLLLGFSSCSNDNEVDVTDNGPSQSVFLKIGGNTPATYSQGAPQAAAPVTFTDGQLYFVNASGVILKHYTLTSGATSDTNIDMTTLTGAGETITNLPGSVSAVHIVGNVPSSVTLPATGNISAVKATVLGVATQSNIGDVSLYGSNTLTAPVSPATAYTCAVDLKPVVARIELARIETQTGSHITGFKVKGIFVDNYYSQGTVDGTTLSSSYLKNNGTTASNFTDAGGSYNPAATYSGVVYDWYSAALSASGTPLAVTPAMGGNVWAYNLFATAVGSAVPRIIIRLTDITTDDSSVYADPQFITITGFKDGGSALSGIQAGKVYSIAAGISFDETDLAPEPNLTTIDVLVTVTLAGWTVVNVTPDI
jgi:hypothetical protein